MSHLQRAPHLVAAGTALVVTIALSACGDRSGKVLADPVFPPPATEIPATSVPSSTAPPVVTAPLTLVAPWVDGSIVPDRHTCTGAGVSPALTWSGVPPEATELAISVVDRTAGDLVHWIVYAMSPIETSLVEGAAPAASFEWVSYTGEPGWAPLCPPAGETHEYVFTVHALNQQLEVADDATAADALSFLNATTIARSSVVGLATGGP